MQEKTIAQSVQHSISAATSLSVQLEKISFLILFLISFLIPLFFIPLTFISTNFSTSLLFGFGVVVSFILYVLSIFLSGSFNHIKSSAVALGLFIVVPLTYFLAGISNGFSRMTFVGLMLDMSTVGFIILCFVYLFLVSVLFRDSTRVFYALTAFLISSIIFSFFVLLRIVFGAQFLSFGIFNSITSTMVGSWNNVAIISNISVLLSLISLSMLEMSRVMKAVCGLVFVISMFLLVLVNFNFVWIALGSFSLLFILYMAFYPREILVTGVTFMTRLRTISIYWFCTFIISIIFMIFGNTIVSHLGKTLSIENIDVRPSLQVTNNIAKQTISIHPLFGSGPNSFTSQWLVYKPADITNTVFWNTDFQYGIGLLPTFVVTTGLLGLISWFIFLLGFVYLGWKTLFGNILDTYNRYVSVTTFSISLFLWIMTIVYVPSVVLFVLTFFFTGLFLASVSDTGTLPLEVVPLAARSQKGFIWTLFFTALSILGIFLCYGLYKDAQSLYYFQKSSSIYNATADSEVTENLLTHAIALVPADTYFRGFAQIEINKLSSIVTLDPKKVSNEEIQKQIISTFTKAVNAGLSARNSDPSNYLNWVALGQVYESGVPLKISGSYENAQFSYIEALKRNPKNPGILLQLAKLEVENTNIPSAITFTQEAIAMKPNYLDAYYLLAQIAIANKDLKGAINSVTQATLINPSDPLLLFQLGYLKFSAGDYIGAVTSLQKSVTLSPQYANAKYYLGLSFEALGQHDNAIAEFRDLQKTNPDNTSIVTILSALQSGKSIYQNATASTTIKSIKKPPIKEKH